MQLCNDSLMRASHSGLSDCSKRLSEPGQPYAEGVAKSQFGNHIWTPIQAPLGCQSQVPKPY